MQSLIPTSWFQLFFQAMELPIPELIIINQVLEGNITPLVNASILQEYREVLSRPKFNFPENLISALYDAFIELGINMETEQLDSSLFPDKEMWFSMKLRWPLKTLILLQEA